MEVQCQWKSDSSRWQQFLVFSRYGLCKEADFVRGGGDSNTAVVKLLSGIFVLPDCQTAGMMAHAKLRAGQTLGALSIYKQRHASYEPILKELLVKFCRPFICKLVSGELGLTSSPPRLLFFLFPSSSPCPLKSKTALLTRLFARVTPCIHLGIS